MLCAKLINIGPLIMEKKMEMEKKKFTTTTTTTDNGKFLTRKAYLIKPLF